jgi:hypothetical protein
VARAEDEGVTVHNGPSHQQQGAAIMIGRRFGRWRVLRRAGSGRGREARWECVCDCGTKRDVSAASLIHGRTKSCGCLHSEQLSKRMREIHRRARQAARGLSFPKIPSGADSRNEGESEHHPARCLPSSIFLGRLSPTYQVGEGPHLSATDRKGPDGLALSQQRD